MITDSQRQLKLTLPTLPNYSLGLVEFTGNEAVSKPFEFVLSIVSDHSLNTHSFIGQPIGIALHVNSNVRHFHGIIEQAVIEGQLSNGYYSYTFIVVPWLSFLAYNEPCQHYEQQSVVDIFTVVCQSLGFSGFDLSRLTKFYPKIAYQTQYNETTLQFLSRLLAENNIDYYFEHSAEGHKMILLDNFTEWLQPKQFNYQQQSHSDDTIVSWSRTQALRPTTVTTEFYDYRNPNANNQAHAVQKSEIALDEGLTRYHFGGNQKIVSDKTLLNKKQSRADIITATSFYAGMVPAKLFQLAGHEDEPQNATYYILLSVQHHASEPSYFSKSEHHDVAYHNEFVCVPDRNFITAQLETSTASINGSQSARVTGGHQALQNSNALATTQTQFFWQTPVLHSATKQSFRVLQPIAGETWGMQFMPRVGDEVLVRYLYGDVNQPIIIGSLHNSEALPYFDLPKAQSSSGIVSRSVGKTDTSQGHKLIFTDTKNKELLELVSCRDIKISVQKAMTVRVNQDYQVSINKSTSINSHTDYRITADKQISLKAGNASIELLPNAIEFKGQKISLN